MKERVQMECGSMLEMGTINIGEVICIGLMHAWGTSNARERSEFKGIANEKARAWPGSEPVIATTFVSIVV